MKFGIQGICYDDKSSFLKGPAEAPQLIRHAFYSSSSTLTSENELNLEELAIEDFGPFVPSEYFDISGITEKNLSRCHRLLTLGGDHSITFPILSSFRKQYPQLSILQIDAHTDLYHIFQGDPYSHACPFARIMENSLADQLVQVGIRTTNDHQRSQIEKFNVEFIPAKEWNGTSEIPELRFPVYLSLDMDALDPAYAPGVSHHEPGGLSTRDVLRIINQIKVPIVGADIVEYNPTRDLHGMTAAVAAKFLKEIIAQMWEND